MQHIAEILLPLFLVILLGYLASYSARFKGASVSINALVFNVALPALLFLAVFESAPLHDFPTEFPFLILLTLVVTSLTLFCVVLLGSRKNATRAAKVAMGGAYGNVVYFGLPISLGILGPEAGVTVGIGQMVHNLFFMILYPVVVGALPGGARVAIWPLIKRAVLLNPVAMSIILGLGLGYSPLTLPSFVLDPVSLVGQIATPGALFCIGLTFRSSYQAYRGGSMRSIDLAITTVAKLVLLPLLTILTVRVLFPTMPEIWVGTMIILAAMPTSTTAYLASVEYDEDPSLLAATVVFTSLISVFTIPLFLLAV